MTTTLEVMEEMITYSGEKYLATGGVSSDAAHRESKLFLDVSHRRNVKNKCMLDMV